MPATSQYKKLVCTPSNADGAGSGGAGLSAACLFQLRRHILGVPGGSAGRAAEYRIRVSGGDALILNRQIGALDGSPDVVEQTA